MAGPWPGHFGAGRTHPGGSLADRQPHRVGRTLCDKAARQLCVNAPPRKATGVNTVASVRRARANLLRWNHGNCFTRNTGRSVASRIDHPALRLACSLPRPCRSDQTSFMIRVDLRDPRRSLAPSGTPALDRTLAYEARRRSMRRRCDDSVSAVERLPATRKCLRLVVCSDTLAELSCAEGVRPEEHVPVIGAPRG